MIIATRRISALTLASALLLACGADDPKTPAGAGTSTSSLDVTGHWVSPCLGPQNGSYTKLTFDIAASTWQLDYSQFGDNACTAALGTVNIAGPYQIGGASTVVANAFEGKFSFASRTVTPHAQGFVDFLKSPAGCGGGDFAVGVATDISAQGCAGLGSYPQASCPADFDVVSRTGDSLHFGQRPANNDMCTPDKRPTALAPFALTKS